jgi:type II secretory ATPase GspE/PulE/Tfp pilus assembly ATPase PilB-like protein
MISQIQKNSIELSLSKGDYAALTVASGGGKLKEVLSRYFRAVLVKETPLIVTIAAAEKLSPKELRDIQFIAGKIVWCVFKDKAFIEQAIGKSNTEKRKTEHSRSGSVSLKSYDTPTIDLVNDIISKAIRHNASDIHFEPLEQEVRVRYRPSTAVCRFCDV